MKISRSTAATLIVLSIGCALPLRAEDPPAKRWKANAELAAVSAIGNTKSTTLSSKGLFTYDWTKALLELEAGALTASNESKTTAEQYFAGEKAAWKFAGKNYLFEKYRWDRDRFAGIDHRHDLSGGIGRQWLDSPVHKLFTEAGAGYTNEERIAESRKDFGSARGYGKYERQLSKTALFSQDGEYIANLKDDEDYRAQTETAVVASITTHFSMKVAFKWKRMNKPPAGFIKDDTYLSAALIVNY